VLLDSRGLTLAGGPVCPALPQLLSGTLLRAPTWISVGPTQAATRSRAYKGFVLASASNERLCRLSILSLDVFYGSMVSLGNQSERVIARAIETVITVES